MEWIIIIGVVLFSLWLYSNKSEDGPGNTGPSPPTSPQNSARGRVPSLNENDTQGFTCRVLPRTVELPEGPLQVLKVEVKGLVRPPRDRFPTVCRIELWELGNDGKKVPVICLIDDWKLPGTPVFYFTSENFVLPFQKTVINDFLCHLSIPVEALTFSRKGLLKLRFVVTYCAASNPDQVVAKVETTIDFSNSNEGYLDASDQRKLIEELAIKLAVFTSAVDGHHDPAEGGIIHDWIQERLQLFSEGSRDGHRKRLNGYTREVFHITEKKEILAHAKDLCSRAHDLNTNGKYEIIELLLHVAQADGKAARAELEILTKIAKFLEVDPEEFRAMRDKALPLTMHEESFGSRKADIDLLLGITSAMQPDDKRRHLNKEYRRWNARSTSSDTKVREQARMMIRKIAEYRSSL